MSQKYPGGYIKAIAPVPGGPYQNSSAPGIWTLEQASYWVKQGQWPTPGNFPYKLWAWGLNTFGQLGLNNRTDYSSPKQVGALTNWVSISSQLHTVAIKTDGTLWSWGYNAYGQLGLGNTTYYSSPKQIGTLTTWSKVATGGGYGHTLAIKTDGTLWSWGYNNWGQLGLNNTNMYSSPKQIGALTNWSKIAASSQGASYAIKTDGTLWVWGENSVGQLGQGNTTNLSSPKQIGALTNWAEISANGYSASAIKTDGTLWSWGEDSSGQLGLGNTANYSSPKQIGALTNWASIACGSAFSIAIKTDGTLWSWGNNYFGTLGLNNTTYYSSPKQIGSLTTWASISAGEYLTLAIKTNGTLWSWGQNNAGQLGQGNTTNLSSPKQIGALTNWSKISAGLKDSFAITS